MAYEKIEGKSPEAGPVTASNKGKTLKQYMEEYEALVILCHLESNNWNRSETARQLGVGREWIWNRMIKYGFIDRTDKRTDDSGVHRTESGVQRVPTGGHTGGAD